MLEQLEANKNEQKEVQMNIQVKPTSENPDLGEGEKPSEGAQNVSYIFRSPEILKMHLDILYKTVPFLEKVKIIEGLPGYLENKK